MLLSDYEGKLLQFGEQVAGKGSKHQPLPLKKTLTTQKAPGAWNTATAQEILVSFLLGNSSFASKRG